MGRKDLTQNERRERETSELITGIKEEYRGEYTQTENDKNARHPA